ARRPPDPVAVFRGNSRYPRAELSMSTHRPPSPTPSLGSRIASRVWKRMARAPHSAMRLALIVASTFVMGGAFALAFLPAAKGLGTAAQNFEQVVGCKGTEDIQFPRFPERSTIYASDG